MQETRRLGMAGVAGHRSSRARIAARRSQEVSLKKYLYVFRPLLACRWLERQLGQSADALRATLAGALDETDVRAALDELVARKQVGDELARAAGRSAQRAARSRRQRGGAERLLPPLRARSLRGGNNQPVGVCISAAPAGQASWKSISPVHDFRKETGKFAAVLRNAQARPAKLRHEIRTKTAHAPKTRRRLRGSCAAGESRVPTWNEVKFSAEAGAHRLAPSRVSGSTLLRSLGSEHQHVYRLDRDNRLAR